jgi:DNA-binding MarR family transcriptional regulator
MARPKGLGDPISTQTILQHWQEAVPNDRLAHLVKDAARALVRALQMRLTRYSVSFGHWTFLRILWEADGLTQRELSRQAGVMEPTTSAALNALEALGYIVRRQKPDNKRKIYVFLTPEGRGLKRKLVPLAERVNEIAVRDIPNKDILVMRRALLGMIENLARDEASAADADRRIRSTREVGRMVSGKAKPKTRSARINRGPERRFTARLDTTMTDE